MPEILIATGTTHTITGATFILVDDEEATIKFMNDKGDYVVVDMPAEAIEVLKHFLESNCGVTFDKGGI